MVAITLDDRDEAVLRHLQRGNADVRSLAEGVNCPPEYLRGRLPELADNGLVLRVHGDVYTITANGKRTIAGSPDGTMDDRIDTPPDVEERIETFDLRADREAAVRSAFAFLRYWGEATEGEIIDAVYSENPAGFESMAEWWTGCVRDGLDDLPRVESPTADDRVWRYTDTAIRDQHTEDGRDVPGGDVDAQTSVTYALERADLTDAERSAVRAAFDFLVGEGEAPADEIRDRIYPDHDAGYKSPSEWWTDCVAPTFEVLPGVERTDADGEAWQYRVTDEVEPASDS